MKHYMYSYTSVRTCFNRAVIVRLYRTRNTYHAKQTIWNINSCERCMGYSCDPCSNRQAIHTRLKCWGQILIMRQCCITSWLWCMGRLMSKQQSWQYIALTLHWDIPSRKFMIVVGIHEHIARVHWNKNWCYKLCYLKQIFLLYFLANINYIYLIVH